MVRKRTAKTRSPRPARRGQRVEQVVQTFRVEEASPPHKARFTATGANFGEAARGVDPEPVFDEAARDQIQGNIIPGFRKDHQHFLFFKLGRKADAKRWLRWIAPQITPMDDALAFVRSFRALRDRLGSKDAPLKATWINIAFSYGAIAGTGIATGRRRVWRSEFSARARRALGVPRRSHVAEGRGQSAFMGCRRTWQGGRHTRHHCR